MQLLFSKQACVGQKQGVEGSILFDSGQYCPQGFRVSLISAPLLPIHRAAYCRPDKLEYIICTLILALGDLVIN